MCYQLVSEKPRWSMIKSANKNSILLAVLVTVNLFLFSGISPLHSIYNMQYDEWLFYLIGKGMVYGKVPYLDLMDHKGPYLFYLFGLMNLLPANHLGLFLISTIIYVFIAIFVYKIVYLIISMGELREPAPDCRGELREPVIVSLIIHLFLSSYYISFGTITSEIITLPFTLSSYYLFLKYLYSDETKHPIKYMIQYGIGAGMVFFIKANAILAYLPIAIYLLLYLIKKKEYANLFKNAVVGLISFIIALAPAIIYSLVTGSFKDMIEGAFIINFLYTGRGLPSAGSIAESLYDTIMKFKEITILCVFSIPALRYFTRKGEQNRMGEGLAGPCMGELCEPDNGILIFYILSLAINLYSVYMAYRPYTNYLAYLAFYLIPVVLFIVHGLCSIAQKLWDKKVVYITLALAFVVCLNVLSYGLVYEQSSINGNNQQAFSSRVVSIYKRSDSYKASPDLLVIGKPLFLYEAFGSVPNEKYFATPVISRKVYSEPYNAIIDKINESTEDVIVVSFNDTMNRDKKFQDQVYEALKNSYVSIGDTKYLNSRAEVYVKVNGN